MLAQQIIRDRLLAELERARSDRLLLADLIEALDRLEAGSYGICTACREPIGVERLLETPTISLCPSCASEDGWRPFVPH